MKIAERYAPGAPDAGAPKVSVAITTWRHEPFIGATLDSVLMQETDFPVEIVIGEDYSPDRTRKIILDYMEACPGLIRLSSHGRNIGSARNIMLTIGRCRGDYVAMLDGDDYWTSPHKLRRQVELMDRRPDLSMCFHAVSRVRDGGVVKRAVRPTGRRSLYRLPDLAHWINISTSSMLFRRGALPALPPWYPQVTQGDWAIQMLLAEQGDIAFIPDVMGTHRLHRTNVWSGKLRRKSDVLREQIDEVEAFIAHLGDARAEPFRLSQQRRRYELVHAWLDEGREDLARDLLRTRSPRRWDPKVELLEPFLCRLHLGAPRLYRLLRLDAVRLNRLLRRAWGRLARPVIDLAAARSR